MATNVGDANFEWVRERDFVRHIQSACDERGVDVEWMSDYWLARLSQQDQEACFVLGYNFPLNTASSSKVASDKSATYCVLQSAGIAAIPHLLIRPDSDGQIADTLGSKLDEAGLPAVVKPNSKSGGMGVRRVTSFEEALVTGGDLAKRFGALAIGPYVQIEHEYRVVMLDDEPLLSFEKVLSHEAMSESVNGAAGLAKHNLLAGAKPELIESDVVIEDLHEIAERTMSELTLRFASVDIVCVDGQPQVLEVNSAVSLEKFSKSSEDHYHRAGAVYARAVEACFDK